MQISNKSTHTYKAIFLVAVIGWHLHQGGRLQSYQNVLMFGAIAVMVRTAEQPARFTRRSLSVGLALAVALFFLAWLDHQSIRFLGSPIYVMTLNVVLCGCAVGIVVLLARQRRSQI